MSASPKPTKPSSGITPSYEWGLSVLLERLSKDHANRRDVLLCQYRLNENTKTAGLFGDTDTLRSERNQIIHLLNQISLSSLDVSFNQLCETDRHPIGVEVRVNNPFVYGNSIGDPSRFIGRRREIRHVYDRLIMNGESTSIVGERRIGKTSLLLMIAHPLTMKEFGLDPVQYVPIYLTMEVLDDSFTPTTWWKLCLERFRRFAHTAESLSAIDLLLAHERITTTNLGATFEQLDRQFILLLDEFERMVHQPGFDASYFAGLRSLLIDPKYHVSLVTATRVPLADLEPLKKVSSPFSNIFSTVVLRSFGEAEAHQLLGQALQETSVRFSDREVQALLLIAGTHPFLLQIAGHLLYEAYSLDFKHEERLEYVRAHFGEQANRYFRQVWEHLDDAERVGLLSLVLLSQSVQGVTGIDSGTLSKFVGSADKIMKDLAWRDLVTRREGSYRLCSSAYADYILDEVKTTLVDPADYDDWLLTPTIQRSISSLAANLGEETADYLFKTLLPLVSSKYRNIIVIWLSDRRTNRQVVELLTSVLT